MANVSSSNGLEKCPKLRFPGFDEAWNESKLSACFAKNIKKNTDGSISNVICNSAKMGLIPQRDYFDKDIANSDNTSGYYIIERDDFVYNPRKSSDAPYGPISRYTYSEAGIVSPLYLCFRAKENVDSNFFEWYFRSSAWHRYIYMTGDSGARHDRVSIKDTDFFAMPIRYPSTTEQEKIASFLTAIEERISSQQLLVDNLKKYKRGVIQKFFSEKDMAQWKVVKLKDVVDIFDGTHQTPNYKSEGVRFISVENILNPLSTEKYISDDDYRKEFKIHPEYGDVLMTRIGDIGRTYYVDFNVDMAYYVSLALFKCSSKIDGRYLAAYISTNNFQKELWERTLHIAFPKKINTGEIGECFIRLPNTARQIAISDQLNLVEQKIRLAEKQHDLLQAMRKGLLQQLFI